ncbi:hypothetical protein FCH28_09820 [Streptomyces piniterrae]|uniref:Uncharacterized protein n=1 Tax=Streptomyces piniterrae TaxID=2571125 RepID=A0A4U0NMJ2_9ACTN|nr:DUF6415 family natural product biosynthesis protein [Streptomyces piniterrae]TJZ55626.1 hypothetical protein FCH28_09820 [Streptomyces piniterrae]
MSAVDEQAAAPTAPAAEDPIDVGTIEATIAAALRSGTSSMHAGEIVDLERMLRGHIALLLPSARQAAERLWRGGIDWHRRTARLDGIERQTRQGLGDSTFSGLVQVQLLARDCLWLLDEYTMRVAP